MSNKDCLIRVGGRIEAIHRHNRSRIDMTQLGSTKEITEFSSRLKMMGNFPCHALSRNCALDNFSMTALLLPFDAP